MARITVGNLEELKQWVGREVAVSDWLRVDQDRIDRFAEATGDRQWIHVDPARARAESPFGATIAHGYLTLSLIPHLMMETLDLQGGSMRPDQGHPLPREGGRGEGTPVSINYGVNRVRFAAPVRAGDRIRARFTLAALEHIPGGVQLTWHARVEIAGGHKPACVAEMIARHYG